MKKYAWLLLGITVGNISAQETLPDTLLAERQMIIKQADKYDWMRLNSGEWLKGELKSLYDKEVEFSSDVLDTLLIAREDIYLFISDRQHSVRFNDGVVLSGTLNISGGYVTVGDSPWQYRYQDLVSIAPMVTHELSAWTVKIGLGANLSKGNTDQTEYSARADIKRRTASNKFIAEFLGYRTTNDKQVTKNNIRANGSFDWFYTQQLYFRPIFFEFYRDPFQNIANKYTLGAGLGYYFLDTEKTEWDLSAGPAYQKTQFDTVEVGEQLSNASTSFFIRSDYEYELTKDIDFTFNYRYTLAERAAGGDAQHVRTGFAIELTDAIDVDIALVWDYLEKPIADGSGVVPKREDYKLIFSLGIDL